MHRGTFLCRCHGPVATAYNRLFYGLPYYRHVSFLSLRIRNARQSLRFSLDCLGLFVSIYCLPYKYSDTNNTSLYPSSPLQHTPNLNPFVQGHPYHIRLSGTLLFFTSAPSFATLIVR